MVCEQNKDHSKWQYNHLFSGNHSLNSSKDEAHIIFEDQENLTLRGIGGAKEPSTVICSGDESGLFFLRSSNITVCHLNFQNCGATKNYLHSGLAYYYSYTISIIQVQIEDSKGFGLHIFDSCGNITIEDSHFTGNNGGNVAIWLKKCAKNDSVLTYLSAKRCYLLNGFTHSKKIGAGIYLYILASGVHVTLTAITFSNNTGNVAIELKDFASKTSSVKLDNCTVEKGHALSGGGIRIQFVNTLVDNMCSVHYRKVITIENTVFQRNKAEVSGGGVAIAYNQRSGLGCTIRQVEFSNCSFTENTAPQGSAIMINKQRVPAYEVHNAPQFSVILKGCDITSNTQDVGRELNPINTEGIVTVSLVRKIVIGNTKFTNNNGTALLLIGSSVQFYNETVFEKNFADYGGAIKLFDFSDMYFDNETRVRFSQNLASIAGGAIYVGNQDLQETLYCFFQLQGNSSVIVSDWVQGILYFEENFAFLSGHAIYGGSVDNCFTNINPNNISYSFELYHRIFQFSNRTRASLVTSNPYSVCSCNNIPLQIDCSIRTINKMHYAGEHFILHVSAVGQTNGSTPSEIAVGRYNRKGFSVRRYNSYPVFSIPLCQKVVIAVYPEWNVTKAVFSVDILQTNTITALLSESFSKAVNSRKIPKLLVNVTILPCPFPFKLDEINSSCNCPEELREYYPTQCDINTMTITRSNNTNEWIGYLNNRTVFAVSKYCQEGRCKKGGSPLSIHNLSEICVEGREGRVCGKCKPNYSLSIGPLNCILTESNCSIWKFFLLLVAFSLSGIFLVCFLAIFNITITEGTINGLLFYANCIHANQNLFYLTPNGLSNSIPKFFISWLNLDFGFQICFYSGMTAYQKLWLEFGYLFFLFLLGVVIVYMSHKFIWFTRLTGRNMVPVLSTIILIAYPKLVKNCLKASLCIKDIYWLSENSSQPWIWYLDETVDCFTGKHLPLLIISILLLGAALLYTLCLLFIQCLQRGSGWCVLRWVNKLRPFFDANTGPCRDHYRFWPGFLLIARFALYLTALAFIDTRLKSYATLGFCTFIFFLACVSPHGVYKKWPLNLLEFSFILNLGIGVGVVAALSDKYFSHRAIVGNISIIIAILTSVLILVYHSYTKLKETRRWKRMRMNFQKRIKHRRGNEPTNRENSPLIQPGQGMPPVIQYNAPREPLLEDN